MRAEAEAVIFAARPVAKVGRTRLAGAREVADLVLGEARGFEPVDGPAITRRDLLVVAYFDASPRYLRVKRRPFREIEHVEREVSRAEIGGLGQRRLERLRGLMRKPEDEIE